MWRDHHDGGSTFKTLGERVCGKAAVFKTQAITKTTAPIHWKAAGKYNDFEGSPVKNRDREAAVERITDVLSNPFTRFGLKVRQAVLIRPRLQMEVVVNDQSRLRDLL